MNATQRLSLFGLAIVVTFALMFVAGKALVPESKVQAWDMSVEKSRTSHDSEAGMGSHSGTSED